MNPQRTQVTLQQIANEGGVSRATVSLALRNHSSIPSHTREKIQTLADQLGYRPNPLVSTLMSYQRRAKGGAESGLSLGLILDFAHEDSWRRYLSPNLIVGATNRASQHGFNLEQFWLGNLGMSPERLSQILYHRNLTGVIVAPFMAPRRSFGMNWTNLAAVSIGYSLDEPNLHRVTTERHQSMLDALDNLGRLGYQRLGLALHINEDCRVHHRWTGAFLRHQQQLAPGRQIAPFIVAPEKWTEKNFLAWFRRNRPEVVLSTTDEPYKWLCDAECKIPDDVSFVHLWKPDASDQYSGIYHNDHAIGEAAVDFLIGMIHRNERGIPAVRQTLVLSTKWVDGNTTRKQPVRPELHFFPSEFISNEHFEQSVARQGGGKQLIS